MAGVPKYVVDLMKQISDIQEDVSGIRADVNTVKSDINGLLDRERTHLSKCNGGNGHHVMRYLPWGGGMGLSGGVIYLVAEKLVA